MVVPGGVAHLTLIPLLFGRVALVTESEVRGVPGQPITLSCRYSVEKNGKTKMCWGRGQCPARGCRGELITTNGRTVTAATSPRYHLGGKIEEGDVSLTINRLGREDSGWYCCRVAFPGLFNDQKVDLNLLVLDETSTPPSSTTKASTPPPLTTSESVVMQDCNHTAEGSAEGLSSTVITTGINSTSENQRSTELPLHLGIGFLILIILTGIITFIFLNKLKNSKRECNSNNIMGLHMHQAIEENIYQISE